MSTRDIRRPTLDVRGVSRYDLVLAVIPGALLVALLMGTVFAVSLRTALTFGSLVSALAVVDAIFLNPPIGDASGR